MRIKFLKKGEQRKFFQSVLINTQCSSLRLLNQFGFDIPYSTLKSYFAENRLLPKEFFDKLIYLSKIDVNELKFEIVRENWGQVNGGKKGKRK